MSTMMRGTMTASELTAARIKETSSDELRVLRANYRRMSRAEFVAYLRDERRKAAAEAARRVRQQ